jgi:hypothetical protein
MRIRMEQEEKKKVNVKNAIFGFTKFQEVKFW